MKPIYVSIQLIETGKQIKKLMLENEYAVKDIQAAMGFEQPQAVYKWLAGKSLPSIDNLVILSRLFHTDIENILVIDEDVFSSLLSSILPITEYSYSCVAFIRAGVQNKIISAILY